MLLACLPILRNQAINLRLGSRRTVTVTLGVGFRADQRRFLPLLITLTSIETNVELATRRITQPDVSLGKQWS